MARRTRHPPLPVVRLFVYGTLMRGQAQDGLLAGFPARAGATRGRLWLHPAGYPVLVADPGGRRIMGELVELADPSRLRVLDLYEGTTDGLYQRVELPVELEGQVLTAWAYTMRPEQVRARGLSPLDLTDWRRSGRGAR